MAKPKIELEGHQIEADPSRYGEPVTEGVRTKIGVCMSCGGDVYVIKVSEGILVLCNSVIFGACDMDKIFRPYPGVDVSTVEKLVHEMTTIRPNGAK